MKRSLGNAPRQGAALPPTACQIIPNAMIKNNAMPNVIANVFLIQGQTSTP